MVIEGHLELNMDNVEQKILKIAAWQFQSLY